MGWDQAMAGARGVGGRGAGASARAREGRNAKAINAPITAAAAARVAVVVMACTNALLAESIKLAPAPPPSCAPIWWAAPTLSLAASAALWGSAAVASSMPEP